MSAPRGESCALGQQAIGWALHALEPDEEMAVLLHLPRCAACQAAVWEAEEVLAALGASVESIDPPMALREALLAAAARTPQRVSVPHPRASEVPSSRHRLDTEASRNLAMPGSTGSWWGRRGRQLVGASLVVVTALAVGGLVVRTNQLEQQRDAESAQAQSLSGLINQLDEPGARHALLATIADPTTVVAAILLVDGERQVYTLGLPANGADFVYVVWGTGGPAGAPVPLGTFDVAHADQGLRTVGSVAASEDFPGYAISIEPGRVAPAVPTTVVASGEVGV